MKSTDRKILFFDIDGTLITEDGRRYFPDSARRALAQAKPTDIWCSSTLAGFTVMSLMRSRMRV